MGENVCHTGLAAWVQAREPTERRRGSINSTRLHSYPHIRAMPLMPLHSYTYTCTTIIFEEANWRASLNYTYHVSWRSYYFNFEQELGWVLFSIVVVIYIINQQCCILENTHTAAGKCSREGAAILTLSPHLVHQVLMSFLQDAFSEFLWQPFRQRERVFVNWD